MKRKRRKRVIVAGLSLAIGGTLAYILLRENPNYVRAAETLPQARAAAVKAFGTLTWENFRAERGIETRDDTDAWAAVSKTAPSTSYPYYPIPGDDTYLRKFEMNRAWYQGIGGKLEDLRFQHFDSPFEDYSISRQRVVTYQLGKALEVGLYGAADAGDVAAVRAIAAALMSYYEMQAVEYDVIASAMLPLRLNLFSYSLLIAGVRNRDDPDVVGALLEAMESLPQLPSPAEAFAGSVRNSYPAVRKLSTLTIKEIGPWLNERADRIREGELMFLQDRTWRGYIKKKGEHSVEQVNKVFRGIGPHTADALEARFWQIAVEVYEDLRAAEADPERTVQMIRDIDERMQRVHDTSYEFAESSFSSTINLQATYMASPVTNPFMSIAARAALEMVRRYPGFDQLPDRLPEDLIFPDPFGGGDVLYRKLDAGFVIYSRYVNGVDDGFVIDEIRARESDAVSVDDGEDYGMVVCYDPIIPAP